MVDLERKTGMVVVAGRLDTLEHYLVVDLNLNRRKMITVIKKSSGHRFEPEHQKKGDAIFITVTKRYLVTEQNYVIITIITGCYLVVELKQIIKRRMTSTSLSLSFNITWSYS